MGFNRETILTILDNYGTILHVAVPLPTWRHKKSIAIPLCHGTMLSNS